MEVRRYLTSDRVSPQHVDEWRPCGPRLLLDANCQGRDII